MKQYITFGQDHKHVINGITYDHNCIAEIGCVNESEGRALALRHFGREFCFQYGKDEMTADFLECFPRGIVPLETSK